MKSERGKVTNGWTIAVMALTVLLALNFLAFAVLCVVGIGMALEPSAGLAAAVFALLGLLAVPVAARKHVPKGWRRGLIAAVAGNFLIVVFFCVAAAALILYMQ